MHAIRCLIAMSFVLGIAGCGSGLEGTYVADVRVTGGPTESSESGKSLDDVRAIIAKEGRTLALERDGRFEWNTGSAVLEGTWRVDGDSLITRVETRDGTSVPPEAQEDRKWRIGDGGELTFVNRYDLKLMAFEVVYRRQ